MKKKFVALIFSISISAQVTPQNVKEAIYTIDPSIPSYFHIPVEISKRMQGKDIKTGNSGLFLMELLQLNQDVSVVIVDTLTDVNGGFHESYKELYKGIEVEGTRCTIHYDKNGLPTYVNGNFRIISLGTISPEISEQHALSQAINNIGAKKYVWEDSVYNRKNQNLFNKRDFSHNPKGSLVIIYSDGKPHLAYKFHIWAIDPESHNQVYIDAETGQVLERYNMKCNIQASVQTLLSGQRNIQTQYYSSNYRLRDYNRGDGIETYKYTPFGDDYISSDNTWTDLSYNDRAALDAHWGLETTYDFYYNKFGRNSYDNNGATIVSYVYRPGYYNASWYTDYHYIEFGEGVNYPLVCLDVAAHEFTHAVTGATSNLGVQDESQAINEGLSDIFAVCVENQAKPLKGDSIWFIAEEDSIIRDIIHPTCKFYRGLGWNYLNYDEGHINSGVFSYWFYLLAHGGSGINEANYPYSISGIGLDMAIQICYLMNCAYLTSNSTFFDARMCSILAAEQLGYNTSVIAQIEEAWFVVGVRDMSIVGDYYYCDSNVYSIPNLPSGVTSVVWSLSGNEASKFNVLNETPVIHQCKLKKKNDAVFSSSTFSMTLIAKVYKNGTLYKTISKTIYCNNGFTCTYWQDAHLYYGVNYPAITQTQMVSATNYVYPGGIVYLQSEYFRGKNITPSGTFENFQYVGQNIVKFSLPPYTSNPFYISVESSGCDDAVQLTFYPMSYYNIGSYSATLSVVSEQEYRISLIRNVEEPAEDTVNATRTIAENSEADGKVSWTVEAVNALTGRKVLSIEPEGTDYVLSTVGWESGLYILRVIVGDEVVATQKIHVR